MSALAHMQKRQVRFGAQTGFSLIELMVALTISLFIVIALGALLANVSRTNAEMAKSNLQVENGRAAIQVLQNDLAHAGFWGGYVPQFDNVIRTTIPTDAPDQIVNPCLLFSPANWNAAYQKNLLGIVVQPVLQADLDGDCNSVIANQQPHTDVLVVRHAAPCVAGTGAAGTDCEPSAEGKLYIQSSLCADVAGSFSDATSITLSAASSNVNGAYIGKTIRILFGTGADQSRTITAYNGATKLATVNANWVTTPDNTSNYTLDVADYVIGATLASLNLTKRNCNTVADLRKFVSRIYYVRTYAATPGDGIPTLVRSDLALAAGALQHQPPVALVEGIEGFRVAYGIDKVMTRCGLNVAVDYTQAPILIDSDPAVCAVNATDSTRNSLPKNRGDGVPDGLFIRCPPAAAPASAGAKFSEPAAPACTVADLINAVELKLYVLSRNREITPGHTDSKIYNLGNTTLGPFNDGYQRHLFFSTVRLNNISGRRETR